MHLIIKSVMSLHYITLVALIELIYHLFFKIKHEVEKKSVVDNSSDEELCMDLVLNPFLRRQNDVVETPRA